MSRKTPPVLAIVEQSKDGKKKAGVPMRRLFRDLRDNARAKRKPAASEKSVIAAAEAKRERRRQRNLDRV